MCIAHLILNYGGAPHCHAKLAKVARIKEEMRVAINTKGVDLDSASRFDEYPDKILAIGGGVSDVYSTEETQIGVWIDGKPLYRKVFEITMPSTMTSPVSVLSYPEEFEVKNWDLIVNRSDGGKVKNLLISPANSWQFATWDYTPHDLYVQCGNSSNSTLINQPAIAILEYTKTTDEASS